jgi:CRP-like cAMP-binding protein
MAELESVELFQGLNPGKWQNLRRIAQERQFAAGQEIFREGDPGDGAIFSFALPLAKNIEGSKS